MGLYSLTYTRPKYVEQRGELSDEKTDGSVKSGRSGCSAGIPDSLGFDNMMNGGTCPPMTVRDFMNYLIYVEHGAENLQFYLWYKDYVKRFHEANTADISLAPEWTQAMEDKAVAKIRKEQARKMRSSPDAASIFRGTDFEKKAPGMPEKAVNPFNTPPQSSNGGSDKGSIDAASHSLPTATSYNSQAADAFQSAGARLPFTIQPFREEINRVIATYIMDEAPRQLNLASWEQKAAVQALSHTTHPTAFRGLIKTVDASLRRQAHPNFVRWSICNGNPARVFFARFLGVFLIVAGFAIAIPITLSKLGRGYRAFAAVAWVLGISTLVAAYKGMCVVLHGMHHRHVRPWELFLQDDAEEPNKRSFDSLGSENSYEDEPWVVKYEKRNVVRKVFDREVWIQEPALRQIQDTIFVQALLASVLLGGALTAIFVAVPGGNFF
ncbi:Regulator of G protein signaling superfamily [Metarhizium album ARSEF 1941]|uniref:Regulator of G protein signaling superfamily n=1 Tax=Metarhizium album (strain ARSEF 1941) TaxID=1081103 RepID=A0A0B2X159_METAS|nr:Regulator of G protein signaling superfamily [Metarhizium album ARSEF 1941]KHN98790.1 Regulator of G protein signaling superfamily [Metarhizium album ARSEF 1941]